MLSGNGDLFASINLDNVFQAEDSLKQKIEKIDFNAWLEGQDEWLKALHANHETVMGLYISMGRIARLYRPGANSIVFRDEIRGMNLSDDELRLIIEKGLSIGRYILEEHFENRPMTDAMLAALRDDVESIRRIACMYGQGSRMDSIRKTLDQVCKRKLKGIDIDFSIELAASEPNAWWSGV